MGGVFSSNNNGQKKKPTKNKKKMEISATDKCILDLKNARDRLNKYKKNLDMEQTKLLTKAKACNASNNKRTALNLMKLRHYKIQELDRVDQQLLNLMEMVSLITSKQQEMEVLDAMRLGKEALEGLHKEMSIDSVLELMEDIEEQNEIERQINDIMINGGKDLVMEDIELSAREELERMEQEILKEENEKAEVTTEATAIELPDAPTKPLPKIDDVQTEKESPAVVEERKQLVEAM